MSTGVKKKDGKNQKKVNKNQPPQKKIIKCTEEMTKCRYSHNKNIINIGPLYSTA